ncbi:unnamed protein product [Protopolystoma xenopodis]|uniref:Uncharacterized protein n=1 Tax=Protopolystoma xenopodis TaxID=117903 RepID=A0A3S5CV24_9PLAT|nr:unnamed protein product [Protopolystoma xenopodis]
MLEVEVGCEARCMKGLATSSFRRPFEAVSVRVDLITTELSWLQSSAKREQECNYSGLSNGNLSRALHTKT